MEDDNIYSDPQRLFAAMTQGNPNIPTPHFPSIGQVRKETKERVTQIFADYAALSHILERYENVLRARWLKKSNQQRRKLLIDVLPTIPTTHRPDFEVVRKHPSEKSRLKTQCYDNFLLPSINLEDLVQPRNLLLFLYSRGHNKPEVFVNSDFNSVRVGKVAQIIVCSYISGYVMQLRGQQTASTYGNLIGG